MRQIILAALVVLAGCFTPVAAPESGSPDGSIVQRCSVDADCPQASADVCAPPVKTSCVQGACVAESLPRFWDGDPGACEVPQHCGCQALAHDDCEGAFDCVSGRCVWSCQQTGCVGDRDCRAGTVCEPGPGCSGESSCVPGCHANEDCAWGELCDWSFDCFTCPCPGSCVAAPECSGDSDCPWQTVCEPTPERPEPHCIPGCRDDYGCTAGDRCVPPLACADCANCPCVGTCEPRNGCSSDAECERGRVCEPSSPECSGETGACVPGCHEDADCDAGASCMRPDCDGCPCPGTCIALPSCRGDAQCAAGEICQGCPELGLAPMCVPGCREDSSCPRGERCQPVLCDGCFCPPGLCEPATESCENDADCGPGSVCELGPECTEPRQCVSGCRTDDQCAGGRCLQTPCHTCPCAGICEETADCTDADRDGWVASCDPGSCPNVRGHCDCDDQDPSVNPGAGERCGDGLDDDCDGVVDEGCGCQGRPCASALDCASGTEYCEQGCCTACALTPPPLCLPGECSFAGGTSPIGCQQPGICASCCSCPAVVDPVCGTNYATYPSPCEAACAGVEVLHRGACGRGEGLSCGYPNSAMERCLQGQYCRDACPMCDAYVTRCTKIGACVEDYDCPAGLTPPGCSAGPGRWECLEQACVFHCP